MKFSTIAAIVLHITLAGVLVASAKNNLPEDTLLTKADYPKQSCFVQIWGDRAEIAVEGTRYELQCSPYRNELGEWEALESPTGDFIKVAENGVTEARIVGQYRVFLPE